MFSSIHILSSLSGLQTFNSTLKIRKFLKNSRLSEISQKFTSADFKSTKALTGRWLGKYSFYESKKILKIKKYKKIRKNY